LLSRIFVEIICIPLVPFLAGAVIAPVT